MKGRVLSCCAGVAGLFVVQAQGCDLQQVRLYNNTVDWAVRNWNESPASAEVFHRYMRKLLDLNRTGCALPASDPDSVLFRRGHG